MDSWQLVYSDGEIIDADDTSSICMLGHHLSFFVAHFTILMLHVCPCTSAINLGSLLISQKCIVAFALWAINLNLLFWGLRSTCFVFAFFHWIPMQEKSKQGNMTSSSISFAQCFDKTHSLKLLKTTRSVYLLCTLSQAAENKRLGNILR